MKVFGYWWGIQLVPENDEDRKALEVVEKATYVQGYDSGPSDENIQRVTPAEAARVKLHSDQGITISR